MSISNQLLFFISLLIYGAVGIETKNCSYSEPSISYLDAAVDMIAKAKVAFPVCAPVLAKEETKPMDCADVLANGHNESGVYTIWPKSRVTEDRPLNVFCDMDTEGGGWTVIQRRGNFNRSKHFFYKGWTSYKNGFGDIEKDFWLGNDNIFALTNQRLYSIRFDLKAVDGEERYALYDKFWIDDEVNNYTSHIKDYSGTAGDSINYKHDNQKFSTKDRDNDNHKNNCASIYKGGWWYNACHDSNLNGVYHRGPHESIADGVNWKSFRGHKESLDTTEMKIRPKNFRKKLTFNENI
ncbi:techylectin-5A-like isoform X1 [Argiope bruennichi]|uniref:techylectin-5A-like isoform X1 n=2 Tax=Argiope bruennichi TaxID=94029 RepID=UPI0024944F7F|nr:techylectin-5A-like isoform X1 [Argiope bruennichi]